MRKQRKYKPRPVRLSARQESVGDSLVRLVASGNVMVNLPLPPCPTCGGEGQLSRATGSSAWISCGETGHGARMPNPAIDAYMREHAPIDLDVFTQMDIKVLPDCPTCGEPSKASEADGAGVFVSCDSENHGERVAYAVLDPMLRQKQLSALRELATPAVYDSAAAEIQMAESDAMSRVEAARRRAEECRRP